MSLLTGEKHKHVGEKRKDGEGEIGQVKYESLYTHLSYHNGVYFNHRGICKC